MNQRAWPEIGQMGENELREKVILPLLSHTPGVKQVTDVHGADERGLDVVFVDESKIRETCVGLQAKAGDIRGGGSSDKTVKTIIDQLELASDLPHEVPINPSGSRQVEHYIVATNGAISNTAREEISRRIKSVPVDFWDITELMRRIREYYPELATGADSETIEYLRELRFELNTLDALDQVSGVAQRKLTDVFVEQDLKRKLDPTVASEGELLRREPTIRSLDLLDREDHSVVIGDQNAGKTSLLRMLAIQGINDLLDPSGSSQKTTPQIPVMIRAKDVVESGSVSNAVTDALDAYGACSLADNAPDDINDGAYAILIDGFSEGILRLVRFSQ